MIQFTLTVQNWILKRMLDLNFIHVEQFKLAIEAPLTATYHGLVSEVEAPYISETIRRFMIQQYGLGAYKEGYEVYTSVNSSMQKAANLSIAEGLEEYDRRHGFRKPENLIGLFPQEFSAMSFDAQLNFIAQELERDDEEIDDQSNLDRVTNFLQEFTETNNRFPGVVLNTDNGLKVLVKNGDVISIPWTDRMDWARPFINENRRGAKPKSYKYTVIYFLSLIVEMILSLKIYLF